MMGDTSSCQKCGTELPGGSGQTHCEVCDPTPRAGIKVAEKTLVVHPSSKRPASLAVPGVKDRIFGDYELIEEIAQGGMGIVYKARQISLNRIVALKMILWGQFATETDIKRFLSEAEAASNLDHPNIVPIFQVGEHAGRHYFSMRFIDGGGLDEHIERYRKDLRAAGRLVATVARAIHFAHQRGILHRDLKPANILLDSQGQPYVTDFGLAKRVSGDGNVTHADVIMGSPNYMSPEQASTGKIRLTTATDVYSLGAILYLLMTGKAPFESDSPMETLKRLAEEEARSPREWNSAVDRDLETICLKCLEKDPTRRYGSAEALAEDLDHWRKSEPISARPVGAVGRAVKWAIRRPTAAALVAVLIGGAVTLVILEWLNEQKLKREKDVAVSQKESAISAWDHTALAAETNRLQLLHFDIGAAVRTMDEGDQTGSLLWLAQALSLDSGIAKSPGETTASKISTAARDENDRIRLGAILESCPRLVSFTSSITASNGVFLTHDVTSPNGEWVAEFSPKGGQMPHGPPPMLRPGDGGFGKGKKGKQQFTRGGRPGRDVGPLDLRLWNTRLGKSESQSFSITFPVHHGALSPDGTRIATATSTNIVEVFELKTGDLVGKPMIHAGAVKSIVFSPAGTAVLTTSLISENGPGEARVWNSETGDPMTPALAHGREIESVTFSPDGNQILTASADSTARLWNLAAGTMVQEFHHRDRVLYGAFSPDGDRIATGCADRTARIWEVSSGREMGEPMIHNFPVVKVVFSPDGRRLITANNDNTTRVWDISSASGAEMMGQPVHHNARLLDVRFTPDAREYLTVTETTARLWDVPLGQPVTPPFVSHSEILHAALDADGRRLLVISADQTVWLWDISPRHPLPSAILSHGGPLSMTAFSPNGTMLVTAGGNTSAKVWSTATGKQVDQLADSEDVSLVRFAPDGKSVTPVASVAQSAQNIDVTAIGKKGAAKLARRRVDMGVLGGDGRRFATTEGGNRTVQVEDTSTKAPLASVQRLPMRLSHLVFDAPGNHLAVLYTNDIPFNAPEVGGPRPAAVVVLDIRANKQMGPVFQLKPSELPLCAALSPDGRLLVVGTDKNSAEIWAVPMPGRKPDTNSLISLEHSGDVISVAFSPDGSRVATASADNSARVWNAVTGEPITPFLIHESRVVQAVFSPDGRRLLTASWDESARVWDAETGEAITPPLLNASPVVSAIFSPDGNRIATVGEDGTVRLWNLPPSRLKQEEVLLVAHLLSGRRLDNKLNPISMPRDGQDGLKAAWDKLRNRLPQLTAPPEDMSEWHARLVKQCEKNQEWYAERFHLDRLLLAKPGDSTLLAQRDQVEEELNKLNKEFKDRQEAAGAQPKAP